MVSFSFVFLVGLALTAGWVSAQEDVPLRVMFVNQFPDQTVDLYWEDHKYPHDHPDRRKLEARIPPRGGWHASDTFLRHGKKPDLS